MPDSRTHDLSCSLFPSVPLHPPFVGTSRLPASFSLYQPSRPSRTAAIPHWPNGQSSLRRSHSQSTHNVRSKNLAAGGTEVANPSAKPESKLALAITGDTSQARGTQTPRFLLASFGAPNRRGGSAHSRRKTANPVNVREQGGAGGFQLEAAGQQYARMHVLAADR